MFRILIVIGIIIMSLNAKQKVWMADIKQQDCLPNIGSFNCFICRNGHHLTGILGGIKYKNGLIQNAQRNYCKLYDYKINKTISDYCILDQKDRPKNQRFKNYIQQCNNINSNLYKIYKDEKYNAVQLKNVTPCQVYTVIKTLEYVDVDSNQPFLYFTKDGIEYVQQSKKPMKIDDLKCTNKNLKKYGLLK